MNLVKEDGHGKNPDNIGVSEFCECAPLPPQLRDAMANRIARTGGRWICHECGRPVDVGAPAD